MKKLIISLICTVFFLVCAAAEETGAIRISDDFISYHGKVTIYWQDDADAAPYTVTYRYVTETLDPQSIFVEEDIGTMSCTLNFLAPGGDYLITVTNRLGSSGTAILSLPAPLPFEDGKLTADCISMGLLACSRPAGSESTRDIRRGIRLESEEMAETMEETKYGMRITLAYPELVREREYETMFVFQAPGGYQCVYNLGIVPYLTYKTPQMQIQWPFIGNEFFEEMAHAVGAVPPGVYTVICYLDGMLAASADFQVR